jgi:hypothetical protein
MHWLYQLAIYALSQPERMKATILYPTMDAEAREAKITINVTLHGSNDAHVVLRPVNLLQLDHLISQERNVVAGLAPARSFAKWLAFVEA